MRMASILGLFGNTDFVAVTAPANMTCYRINWNLTPI